MVTPGASDVSAKANTPLPPGNYRDITVDSQAVLTLSPGTYNVNSIKLTGRSKIAISTSGPVIINVAGVNNKTPLDFTGGAVSDSSGIPAKLILLYGGTGEIDLTGSADSYAIVYAPNATARLIGGAGWFGALVVKTLDDSGGAAIHYDRSLGR